MKIYKRGKLKVICPVDANSGYGWLAYRLFCTLPPTVVADFYVLPPYDAVRIYELEKEGEQLRVCICAVDGTEIPQEWRAAGEYFTSIVLMLDHNDFAKQWDKVIGEFYPAPRTALIKQELGLAPYSPPQEKKLGTVYTRHYRKNLETIVAVAHELYKRKVDARIEVISDPQTAWLWKNYAPPNLSFKCSLTDEELVAWYLSLWAFFSFSMGEGGALPAAEAAVLGVPTILPYHTAFKFLPRSVTLWDMKEVPAQGDPNYAGVLHLVNPMEFIDVIRNNDLLPAPPPLNIPLEDISWLSQLNAHKHIRED